MAVRKPATANVPRERSVAPGGAISSSAMAESVASALAALRRGATNATLDGMARYGIPSKGALGVPVGKIKAIGAGIVRQGGRDQALALALWETGVYEARLLATFVGDPATMTPAQMDRWAADFDSWAVCDTACFALFDRSPHAFKKIDQWAKRSEEFVLRGSFALLASVALHDKATRDEAFLERLPLIEASAGDERNFVKKGVSWALRSVGRRSAALHAASVDLAARLAESPRGSAAKWVGSDALRDLTKPAVLKRLAGRSSRKR